MKNYLAGLLNCGSIEQVTDFLDHVDVEEIKSFNDEDIILLFKIYKLDCYENKRLFNVIMSLPIIHMEIKLLTAEIITNSHSWVSHLDSISLYDIMNKDDNELFSAKVSMLIELVDEYHTSSWEIIDADALNKVLEYLLSNKINLDYECDAESIFNFLRDKKLDKALFYIENFKKFCKNDKEDDDDDDDDEYI